MHWRKHLGVTELYAKKGFFWVLVDFYLLGTVCVTIWFLSLVRVHDGAHISFDLLHSVLRAQVSPPPVLCLVHGIIHGSGYITIEKGNKTLPAPGLEHLREKYNEALMSGDTSVKLCLSCEIVKPERSKHSSVRFSDIFHNTISQTNFCFLYHRCRINVLIGSTIIARGSIMT